jgi:acetylornithine aminotransferase
MSRPPLHPWLERGTPYAFVALEQRARELAPPGVPPIHFGIGDPREETPAFIRQAMIDAVPAMSSYPPVAGTAELRAACARWMQRRFGVTLDPERHVLPVNGSKEAVFSLAFTVVAPDRRAVVIPTPAYPVYEAGAVFAGAEVVRAPLESAKGWRFDPDQVPGEVWNRTALLWLNLPHNPTGATLDAAGFQKVLEKARRFGFWVASDEAYAEVYFHEPPHSALEFGLENAIVFHTLSKRSAMTGYRSGFMAGDPRLIDAQRRFRPNLGASTPEFIQKAAVAAWNDDAHAEQLRARYARKRDVVRAAFERFGWTIEASEASFFLWARAPGGDDVAFVERLMRVGVIALPGSFLDPAGAGYVRWALVPTLEQCREAVERMSAVAAAAAR